MALSSLIHSMLRPYWRMTRGLTMGVQAMVLDKQDQILLVKHTYREGWHFPGGGVEWGEHFLLSLARELKEEANIDVLGDPELFGVYANTAAFKGDHIAVYIVRDWHLEALPRPNAEIKEARFFALDDLPQTLVEGALNRLEELRSGKDKATHWTCEKRTDEKDKQARGAL